jgi:hypothetical protein
MTESNMLNSAMQAVAKVAKAATGLQQECGEIWRLWGKHLPANGGLLEVHLGACQQAVVDFKFAD